MATTLCWALKARSSAIPSASLETVMSAEILDTLAWHASTPLPKLCGMACSIESLDLGATSAFGSFLDLTCAPVDLLDRCRDDDT